MALIKDILYQEARQLVQVAPLASSAKHVTGTQDTHAFLLRTQSLMQRTVHVQIILTIGDTIRVIYFQQTVVGDASTASGVVRTSEPVAVAADLVAVVDVWCGAAAGHARCQLVDGDAVLGQVAADVGAGPSDVGGDLLTVAGGEGCLAVQPTSA